MQSNESTRQMQGPHCTKPVIAVLGASGKIGKATIQCLSSKYSDKFDVRAGVRDPHKSPDLAKLPGVTVFQAEMGNDKLKETLKGVDRLYIVTPGAEHRAFLTIYTANAAKEAGVKFILVVSATSANISKSIFGSQFTEIEEKMSKLGVPYSILRLSEFVENIWKFKDTIKKQSMIRIATTNLSKPISVVAVEDAGKAGAVILTDPNNHVNTTYTLISDRYSYI